MRKSALLLSSLAVLLSLFALPGTAPADPAPTAAVANCDGHTVLDAQAVPRTGTTTKLGAIQLCRDGGGVFAMYINYGTMPYGRMANAWLYRYVHGEWDGARWSCDGPGGNGHVLPGQTWCKTRTVPDPDWTVTFRARGLVHELRNGQWVVIGDKWTRECDLLGCWV